MFSTTENQNKCVVISKGGMQVRVVGDLPVSDRMVRIDVRWAGRDVVCVYFPDSQRELNTIASLIAGSSIYGNAVILGISIDEIKTEQSRPKSWLSLAKALPKVVPLDELARARLLHEREIKSEAWREYFARKNARKLIDNRLGYALAETDIMTPEQIDAANQADAEFAAWNVEEEFVVTN